MDISKLDTCFTPEDRLDLDDLVWFDVREGPMQVYGLYQYQTERPFRRLPLAVAEATSPEVLELHTHPAGGRARFRTDSPYVAIRAEFPEVRPPRNIPLTGIIGFDLYRVRDGRQRYVNTFMPPYYPVDHYEALIPVSGELEEYVINFPHYNPIDNVYIGIQKGSRLLPGGAYRNDKPVIFYGSSITQGASASRPGNTYQDFISRDLDLDYINLGFSNGGRAEDVIADYMAGLEMCMFVSDYDYNADTTDYLLQTHARLYRKIREKHPLIPYIMITKPNPERGPWDSVERRSIIYKTYQDALDGGDRNVYFIDGASLFGGPDRDACTVDNTHPNDLGHYRMAYVIGDIIRKALYGL